MKVGRVKVGRVKVGEDVTGKVSEIAICEHNQAGTVKGGVRCGKVLLDM